VGQFEFSTALTLAHFGTLKIAMRFEPMLIVVSNVPINARSFPVTAASRHRVPLVILMPFLALLPWIVISLAISNLLGLRIVSHGTAQA